jgi:heme oxygenase
MMLRYLKTATSTRHAALERRLPLRDVNLSHASYRGFVQRLFGFHDPLETRLLALRWCETVGIDGVQRRKTPRRRHKL